MNEQENGSRWRRVSKLNLIFIVMVVGIAVWAVIPFVQEFFKFERLDLVSYKWTMNSLDEISQISFHFVNNGTKTLTISKIWINGTLTNSTEWQCYRDNVVSEELHQWMYVAPRSVIFKEGSAYNFTVGTETGASFSYMIKVTPEFVVKDEARISEVSFLPAYTIHSGDKAFVCVENNGTAPAIVVEGWINDTQYEISRKWIWPGDVGGEARVITFNLHWTSGQTYNFTIRTASGNFLTEVKEGGPPSL